MRFVFLLLFAGTLFLSAGSPLVAEAPACRAAEPDKGFTVPDDLAVDENAYRSLMQFLSALAVVKTHYVDPEKTTYQALFKTALRGMMHELDPFSNYESADALREIREGSPGRKAGVGLAISLKNRILEVVDVFPEGPAAKAGLRPGDVITAIDGEDLHGKGMKECLDSLRGPPDSIVALTVYRPSDDSTREFTVRREILTRKTVTGARIIDPAGGVAYLRIVQFGSRTAAEVDSALERLKNQSMRLLVIDLRNNPGGLLNSAVAICSRFLKPGITVVSVEGRRKRNNTVLKSIPCKSFPELPVAILVNGNSASAAEILAACLQDHKRAVLIGEKTFGKGSVQTLIPFGENEVLRITTAKYYTPGRRIIHGNGIQPDISVPLTNAQRFALTSQLNLHPGEINPESVGRIRDIQLERAVEVMKTVEIFRDPDRNGTTLKNRKQSEHNNSTPQESNPGK